jgi:hypothetical protein
MTKFYQFLKLRKTRNLNVWNTFEVQLNNQLFSKSLFEKYLNQFWSKVSVKFTDSNHMFILFKIKYQGSDYTTIGKLQRLNKNDINWYLNWIINNMIYKAEYYNETAIESIIFSYGFKKEKIENKIDAKTSNLSNFQSYKNNNIPISYNPLDYGKLISEFKFENYTQYVLQTKDNFIINFLKFEDYNEVEVISSGDIIIKFKDEFISENKFMRFLDNKKYYFENNKEILFMKEMKTKFISKLAKSKNLTNNFITLDIETFIKDNILIPYMISIYDGEKVSTFSIWDFNSSEDMILTCLSSIFIRKYTGYNVYIHNLAKFDIIFLFKYLVKLGSVQPVIHNGRIISINLNFGKNNEYQIKFRDSYLILLNSLSKLSNAFGVENKKSIFPHLFVNENNLDYIGQVPEFKYFFNISKNDYNNYCKNFNNNWNLRKEAIKYCEIDVISLYQVINKFALLIFSLFQRNILHYPTLPSLAFAIYRSNFMSEDIIPQLSGKIANDIREGYTGGSVDVYIHKSKPGVKIKCLDVNSLYPSQMESQLMPIGTPTFFKGDIRAIDSSAFGFFYCKIIAPDNLLHPIIQTHIKTSNGLRTIAPLGSWSDMIFSAEMDNAINHGYKFEILWGYTFKAANIFKDYVEFLYNLRSKHPTSHPLNFIAKILLNSLYGRFGMDDRFTEVSIIHKDFLADFENKYLDNIKNSIKLDEYYLIEFLSDINEMENDQSTHNISIGIASAITAYSRMHMSQFKNNPKINLYYTDTDSIYTDSDIDDYLIDPKILGKLKLEYICNKAIFLAPKVYCLETFDNKLIYKVKGLKHEIELTMNDFETLLNKDVFIKKDHTKWIRNLSKGQIQLLEQVYTLKVTDSKRKLIYKNNKLIATKPYKMNTSKVRRKEKLKKKKYPLSNFSQKKKFIFWSISINILYCKHFFKNQCVVSFKKKKTAKKFLKLVLKLVKISSQLFYCY